MKTGLNMDNTDMVEIPLGPKLQAQHTQERVMKKSYSVTKIALIGMCCISMACIATFTAYLCLKSNIKETDAVFMTKDGDQIQEHIKLTDVEAIFSNDDFTMIYDFSKGLIVHRWYKVDAVHDSCFVESFNTSQFVRLDQLKSMIDTVKPNQVNSVEKDESVTYVSTDIRLSNNVLGPASRSLCDNKDVFFIRRVPEVEITDVGSSRVKRQTDRLVIKEKTCVLFIFCKTRKVVVKKEHKN